MTDWFCANFTHDEMKCSCCHREVMSPGFMARLQRAREIAGIPFIINSGWRCEEHNRSVGGSAESSHLTGCAADIQATTLGQRYAIINGLIKAGFKRIGIHKIFLHVDNSQAKTQNIIWLY